jgi:hypothetical protein
VLQAIYDEAISTVKKMGTPFDGSGYQKHNLLSDELGAAVRELVALHEQQFQAIAEDDSECSRFDRSIHMANENKQRPKYAYLRHVVAHDCSKTDANETRAWSYYR